MTPTAQHRAIATPPPSPSPAPGCGIGFDAACYVVGTLVVSCAQPPRPASATTSSGPAGAYEQGPAQQVSHRLVGWI